MSLKTDLPYEITRTTTSIQLGKAAGTSWSMQPGWQGYTLTSMVIKRQGSSQTLNIDVTLIFFSTNSSLSVFSTFTTYDQRVTNYIESGQTTTEIEMKEPVVFSQPNDIIRGIITLIECEGNTSNMVNLSADMLGLLNNTEFFHDAVLKCGETEIAVHKCILSVRSSVFADMFKNKMKEGISGVVEIENLEPHVLNAMLKYIYSDKTDDLTDVLAGDLLFAADEYLLKELKLICIDKLKSSLKENNVFRALLLGHLHDRGLKDYAKDFVCKCKAFSELEKTEDWTSLKRNNPDLAIEVLTSVVTYLQRK